MTKLRSSDEKRTYTERDKLEIVEFFNNKFIQFVRKNYSGKMTLTWAKGRITYENYNEGNEVRLD
jgi:hypothetical protein